MLSPAVIIRAAPAGSTTSRRGVAKSAAYLGEGGASALGLDGDGLGPALEDLVNVLLAELGPLVLLVHDGAVGAASQQVLDLLLGELLLLRRLVGDRRKEEEG